MNSRTPDGPTHRGEGKRSWRDWAVASALGSVKAIGRFLRLIHRGAGAIWLLSIVGPPIVVLALTVIGAAFKAPEVPADSFLTVLLTATGVTLAFGSLCFSYSRTTRDDQSRNAALEAGLFFMAALVMQAISLGAFYLEAVSATPKAPVGTFAAFLLVWTMDLGLRFSPILAVFAILRLYVHLLLIAVHRIAGTGRNNPEEGTELRVEQK